MPAPGQGLGTAVWRFIWRATSDEKVLWEISWSLIQADVFRAAERSLQCFVSAQLMRERECVLSLLPRKVNHNPAGDLWIMSPVTRTICASHESHQHFYCRSEILVSISMFYSQPSDLSGQRLVLKLIAINIYVWECIWMSRSILEIVIVRWL